MRNIRNVLIIVNMLRDEEGKVLGELNDYLSQRGISYTVSWYKDETELKHFEKFDLAVSLGGDGTVLYCARLIQNIGIPILAVNLGTFGFITEIAHEEWKSAFEAYEAGKLSISYRVMLRVTVERDQTQVFSAHGLNDAVVNAGGLSRVVNLRLSISNTHLGDFRSDGVIVATPTGSTAYSMAAGGPIVHADMDALVLTPICPFTLSIRPLIISGNDVIQIEAMRGQRTALNLSVDGQEMFALREGDMITLEKSHSRALIIESDRRNFYEIVRSKLKWSGG